MNFSGGSQKKVQKVKNNPKISSFFGKVSGTQHESNIRTSQMNETHRNEVSQLGEV